LLVQVPERGRGRRSRQVKGQNADVKMQNAGRGRWARGTGEKRPSHFVQGGSAPVCSDRSTVGSEGHRARRTRKSKCKYQNAKCPEAESATNEGAKEGQPGDIFVKSMRLRTCSTGSNGLCEKWGRCRTEARSGGWGKGRSCGCSRAGSRQKCTGRSWDWGGGRSEGLSEAKAGAWSGGRGSARSERWCGKDSPNQPRSSGADAGQTAKCRVQNDGGGRNSRKEKELGRKGGAKSDLRS